MAAIRKGRGLDIIGDGEIRRESYSNHFANALDGIDLDNPGKAKDRSGEEVFVPRITGPISRRHAVGVERRGVPAAHTDRRIKFTVPGPFTMSSRHRTTTTAIPRRGGAGLRRSRERGGPRPVRRRRGRGAARRALHAGAAGGRRGSIGLEALDRALQGVDGTTCVHICFGYAALIHARPEGYSYLPELAGACCRQISIETAQSNLDCSVLDSPARQADPPGGDRSVHRRSRGRGDHQEPRAARARACATRSASSSPRTAA
jgi:5-methyltetrahydropteroyltriglutamate--homocysteine methyltransferase